MAKKKKDLGDLGQVFRQQHKADLDFIQVTAARYGLELSPVEYVNPAKLKPNPENRQFFKRESGEYFERLKRDIQARGILVPLICRKDYLVLAGENRLEIALELQLEAVPVQRVLSELTPAGERQFLIKDNLLRRQLSGDERKKLIAEAYAEDLLSDWRGKIGASPGGKVKKSKEKSEDLQGVGQEVQSELLPQETPEKISEIETLPERIERETGIKAGTAKRIVAEIRRERKAGVGEKEQARKPDPAREAEKLLKQVEKIGQESPAALGEIIELVSVTRANLRGLKKLRG